MASNYSKIAIMFSAMAASAITLAEPAAAQSYTRIIPVSFTGTVTNAATDTIMIKQPDGSLAPYTGPVPAYPYKTGDNISISFNLEVPTRDFYASPLYAGQQAADGIYTIRLTNQPVNFADARQIGGTEVSGPVVANPLPTMFSGITLKYDANADSYSLAIADAGYSMQGFMAPTYTYNAASNTLTSAPRDCYVFSCDQGTLAITGNGSAAQIGTALAGGLVPQGALPIGNLDSGGVVGWFSGLSLSGLWNMPLFTGGGTTTGGTTTGGTTTGGTAVPEPGMIGLFGGAAAALVMARRRRRKLG